MKKIVADIKQAIEELGGRERFNNLCNPETLEEAQNACELINQHLRESVVFSIEKDGCFYICGIAGQFTGNGYMPNAISTAQYHTNRPMYDYGLGDGKIEFTEHYPIENQRHC